MLELPKIMFIVGAGSLVAIALLIYHICKHSEDIDDDSPCPYCGNPITPRQMDRLKKVTPQKLIQISKEATKKSKPQPWLHKPMTDKEIEEWYKSSCL